MRFDDIVEAYRCWVRDLAYKAERWGADDLLEMIDSLPEQRTAAGCSGHLKAVLRTIPSNVRFEKDMKKAKAFEATLKGLVNREELMSVDDAVIELLVDRMFDDK